MKVFLGGTCTSNWRYRLIPMLKIDFFNPVVEDWNKECKQREIEERDNCDFCLYVITPKMEGVYSVFEVADDSNKRPEKTVFCFLEEDENSRFSSKGIKSLKEVARRVEENGAKYCRTLEEVAEYLNSSKVRKSKKAGKK